jgi:hypothetical protein
LPFRKSFAQKDFDRTVALLKRWQVNEARVMICDQIYGEEFRLRVAWMKVEEVITAAHSPYQNAFVERAIGPIRRECLDHMIGLSDSATPPIRPERHNPTSIATMQIESCVVLAKRAPRCPFLPKIQRSHVIIS